MAPDATEASHVLLSEFDQALESFLTTLTPQEQSEFRISNVSDVYAEIARIEKDQERKGLLRGLKRIQPFIDGLTRYSNVIEQFVTMNPGILAAIWGPIKLLLQISSAATKSFDTILTSFRKIGYCLPRFDSFAQIFRQSPRMSLVLVWLYSDILEFYSEVLKFFRKKGTRFKPLSFCVKLFSNYFKY